VSKENISLDDLFDIAMCLILKNDIKSILQGMYLNLIYLVAKLVLIAIWLLIIKLLYDVITYFC
jgi:hypothetical protein